MKRFALSAVMLGLVGFAHAQPLPEPSRVPSEVMGDRPTTRPPDERPANRPPNPTPAQPEPPNRASTAPEAATRADAPLEQGASSFTEGQARSRMEQAGFSQIAELRLADGGIWRATAQRDGRPVQVGLDYRGTVRVD